MSVAKKKSNDYKVFPGATDPQSRLRVDKAAAEQLRDKIQSHILENPKASKKAALLISLWIAGKTRTKK
ncbi:MAG: hypothetical protein AB7K68_16550 [Bacteriovoracia bacterium]